MAAGGWGREANGTAVNGKGARPCGLAPRELLPAVRPAQPFGPAPRIAGLTALPNFRMFSWNIAASFRACAS